MNQDQSSKATTLALLDSVEKWIKVSTQGARDGGTTDCPLCKLFFYSNSWSTRCHGCPVFKKTGRTGCRDTPYPAFDEAVNEHAPSFALAILAGEEALFLLDLLRERLE